MEKLENPSIMVDECRRHGETTKSAISRAGEQIFQQYDSKLKETEASHGIHFVICIKGAPDPVARELYYQTEYCYEYYTNTTP